MKYEYCATQVLTTLPGRLDKAEFASMKAPLAIDAGCGDGWEFIPPLQCVPVITSDGTLVLNVATWRRALDEEEKPGRKNAPSLPIPVPVITEIANEIGRSQSTVRRALSGVSITAQSRAALAKALRKRGLDHLIPLIQSKQSIGDRARAACVKAGLLEVTGQ